VIDRLTEIGRCYGMDMNVEKSNVMRISRQPSPIQIMIDQKQVGNVEYLNYLGSIKTDNAKCRVKLSHYRPGWVQRVPGS
jgi:hypothetical protein